MMKSFDYQAHPVRVLFGVGRVGELGSEIERLGLERVIVVSTPGQAERARAVAATIGRRCTGVFAGAAMHTPVTVTATALAAVDETRADGVIAFGGGSAIGLGKAIALRTDLPQIAVPQTYAGSEMTPIIGETDEGRKVTRTTSKVLPEVVIYDVELTIGLPVATSGMSGINAIAHGVEALYAHNRNPVIDRLALDGIAALARALPDIARDPGDVLARTAALYGAWLCGTCLGAVGMSLHHKLCHVLGGALDLPHAALHAVILPHAVAYNAEAVPDIMVAVAGALGAPDATGGLFNLAASLGAPRSLQALGMREHDIERAVDLALASPYPNPRPLERSPLRRMLRRAWAGDPPIRQG